MADGADKFVKALRFVTGKQEEDKIVAVAENSRKFNVMLGSLYEDLASLSATHPQETMPHLAECGIQRLAEPAAQNLPHTLQQRLLRYIYM